MKKWPVQNPPIPTKDTTINIAEMVEDMVNLPYHPMVVHFPIALFMTAMFLEMLNQVFKKAAFHTSALIVYVLAALSSPVAVLLGLWDEKRFNLHHPLVETHEQFGLMTMWVSLASLVVLAVLHFKNIKYPSWVFFLMTVALAGLVSITAFFGGEMVYEYGVGVEAH